MTCVVATLAAVLLLLVSPSLSRASEPLSVKIDGGSYMARLPAGWDGKAPLATVVYFHGYRQKGATVMRNNGLLKILDKRQILLISPDGEGGRWAHQGSPRRATLRDDDAFVRRVLADVRGRWPVDPKRLWASGFSIGGSMTWHVACFIGKPFTAFIPVAGAFWRPHPLDCPAGPANILHTHGTADTVVPMKGRPIAGTYHQGDVREGMAFWRHQNGCAAEPTRVTSVGTLTCKISDQCASGGELQLCLHGGQHGVPKGWANPALDWAERVSAGK